MIVKLGFSLVHESFMGEVIIPVKFRDATIWEAHGTEDEVPLPGPRVEYTAARTVLCSAPSFFSPRIPVAILVPVLRIVVALHPCSISARACRPLPAARALPEGPHRRPGAPRGPRRGRLRPVPARAP